MSNLEVKFRDFAIIHNNMILFKPVDAIRVVMECFELNKSIYGIDAFILNEPYIQPFMEHSINANENFTDKEQMESFVSHLKKYLDSELIFEVVYEGY